MESGVETGVEVLPLHVESCTVDSFELNSVDSSVMSSLKVTPDDRQHWGEASHLLFQPGYVQVLKQMALSGQLQMYNIRSVAWRLFLGCLPEEQDKWAESVTASRDVYSKLKKKHITDPHIASASLDVTINNPLSQADSSPWRQFFVDNEMRQMVNQDVVRTFPDVAFFKQAHIQESMLDILFIYCKEKPDLGYRQGMHEILAPIVFVLHAEEREPDDITLAPEVQTVMDSLYLEHDAYTIFRELMEDMELWYMGYTLEADYYRTQALAAQGRKMKHDPRTNKPFEQMDVTGNSAIGRKLEKIHHMFLKRADEVLYTHLMNLTIPAQTYGIRWIRLLFGREFPLPCVLELWDAVFADGPSLSLIDYICVAMLMHIREVLIEGDYAVCMQHLMRFPALCEVNYLVQRALHLRNPSVFPSPRIWTYHPSRVSRIQPAPSAAVTQLLDENFSTGTGSTGSSSKTKTPNHTDKITDFLHTRLNPRTSSTSGGGRGTARPDFHKSGSRSPSPSRKPQEDDLTDEQLFAGSINSGNGTSGAGSRKGRFRIIGKSSKSNSTDKEMMRNPKAHPLAGGSLDEVGRLSTQLEDLEAKCLYCGGKMDSMISVLQDEIPNIPDLDQDTENTLLLTIAGLKQIRDLLLKKIPFSGDSTLGWETNTRTFNSAGSLGTSNGASKLPVRQVQPDSAPSAEAAPLPEALTTGSTSDGNVGTSDGNVDTSDSNVKADDSPSPDMKVGGNGSDDASVSSMGDDWVNLSHSTHPLNTSND